MALGGGEYAGGLPVGLAAVAIGSPGHQAVGGLACLHAVEQFLEVVRGEGEPGAQGPQVALLRRLLGNDVQDQPGDQRLGLLVPVRLTHRARGVVDEGVGQRRGFLRRVDLFGIQAGQRVEGGTRLAGDAERVDHMDRTEAGARSAGDPGVLALGVDADDRAVDRQQIRDERADALAGAGGGDGQQV